MDADRSGRIKCRLGLTLLLSCGIHGRPEQMLIAIPSLAGRVIIKDYGRK